jgi:hypothetical protein
VFLVEAYLPGSPDASDQAFELARAAAQLAAQAGEAVRHLGTTLVPSDEICLHLFEAPSRTAMQTAAARVCLACDRIVEAEHIGPCETDRTGAHGKIASTPTHSSSTP